MNDATREWSKIKRSPSKPSEYCARIFATVEFVGMDTFKSGPRTGFVVKVVPPPIGMTKRG